MNTYTLRSHQTEAINQIRQSMRAGNKRVALKAPCGFGKTLVNEAMGRNMIWN